MQQREATESDVLYMANHTTSRGCCGQYPETVDYVYALEEEGQVWGIGGIKLMTPTVAWAWMDWSEHAHQHKARAYRVVKEWLNRIVPTLGIKRLMAAIECDFPEAITTVEHLGFQQESIMLNWTNKKPAYMYVRLME